MSLRPELEIESQAVLPAVDTPAEASLAALQSLVQLVGQIDNAILVVESPRLAAELLAQLKAKAA